MRSRISIRVCPSVHSSVGPKRILSDASYAEYSALLENALWTNAPTDGRMNIEQTLLYKNAFSYPPSIFYILILLSLQRPKKILVVQVLKKSTEGNIFFKQMVNSPISICLHMRYSRKNLLITLLLTYFILHALLPEIWEQYVEGNRICNFLILNMSSCFVL